MTGGLSKNSLWLTFGQSGRLHVDAQLQPDGKLTGSAIELPGPMQTFSVRGPATFNFVATPKKP